MEITSAPMEIQVTPSDERNAFSVEARRSSFNQTGAAAACPGVSVVRLPVNGRR